MVWSIGDKATNRARKSLKKDNGNYQVEKERMASRYKGITKNSHRRIIEMVFRKLCLAGYWPG